VSDLAIGCEGIAKQYRIGQRERYRSLRDTLSKAATAPLRRVRSALQGGNGHASTTAPTIWALKDVSFEVKTGEVVGVIGRNGAGKSTLLKILSRITSPTRGSAEIYGRVGSLLEVGTGFHPELTGRENVYMNGSVLGMRRHEIDRSFDSIVTFAGVERFLDTPVKRFSSGMQLRLAFAVAAHLQPEVLLIDEVLAVGDQQFQKRCTEKMRDVANSGRTILFVSHNIPAIQNLCTRAILLEQGRLIEDGDVAQTLSVYNTRGSRAAKAEGSLATHPGRAPHFAPWMESASIRSRADDGQVTTGADVQIEVAFRAPRPIDNVNFGMVVKDSLGAALFTANNVVQPSPPLEREIVQGSVSCQLSRLPLLPGTYSLDCYLGTNGAHCDVVTDAVTFDVHPADIFGSGKLPSTAFGRFFVPVEWEIRRRC
jgi:homopolymeric O-antigen transport system ATP-binding protein